MTSGKPLPLADGEVRPPSGTAAYMRWLRSKRPELRDLGRQQKRAYTLASRRLRERHRSEFTDLYLDAQQALTAPHPDKE